jgi:hypothetical protein
VIKPLAGTPFRAGQTLSLLAGVLIPLLLYAFMRRLDDDPAVAMVAAYLAAFSPLMIAQSVYVMAESLFVALLLGAFFLAARPPRPDGTREAPWQAATAGALFGLAFLVRGQALLAAPAFLVLLARDRPAGRGFGRWIEAIGVAVLVASPLLIRNLMQFGSVLHNDAAAFAVWPYVDHLRFSHGLDRPPEPLTFALVHLRAVAGQILESTTTFATRTLARDILGSFVWYVPLLVGGVIAARRLRTWAFAWLFLLASLPFLFAVYWAPRYFATLAPVFFAFTALGAVSIWQRVSPRISPARGAMIVAVLLGALAAYQSVRTWRAVPRTFTPELDAARAEAPFLTEHLAPDEAVMVNITSYWAWFTDRPAVHLVIDDDERTRDVLRRLRVRYAALPTSRLDEYAGRYPGGALPSYFELEYQNTELDVSIFRIRDP